MSYSPVDEFIDGVLWFFVILIVFGGLISLIVWGASEDNKHDDKMRNDFSQCQKDGKEWVLTGKNGLDGICVKEK